MAQRDTQVDGIERQLSSLSLDGKPPEGQFLYRILRPDENPEKIVAKDPGAQKTVLSHVNCGGRAYYQSQFVSTSASLDAAKHYKGATELRICEIPVDKLPPNSKIVDLTTEENRDKYLGNAVCKKFAKKSEEVLLECSEPVPGTVVDPPQKREGKTSGDTKQEL